MALNHNFNAQFQNLANQVPLVNLDTKPQFPGFSEEADLWIDLLNDANQNELNCSPESIIETGSRGDWKTFTVLVGRWGGMIPGPLGKPFQMIYGHHRNEPVDFNRLDQIEAALTSTFKMFIDEDPLQQIWNHLRALGWSKVMISKCLHFQARSAGLTGDVPVPVDGAMCVHWLWPQFKNEVNASGFIWPRPAGINRNDFESYNRYLSAMKGWAQAKEISISDLEFALFARFRNSPDDPIFN